MSITKLQEGMLHTKDMDELIDKHKNNYQKIDDLLSLQKFFNSLGAGAKVYMDEENAILYESGQYIPCGWDAIDNIYKVFPNMKNKILKNKKDLSIIFDELRQLTGDRLERADDYKEMLIVRSKQELITILANNNIEVENRDIINLTNLLANNPLQDIKLSLKRVFELKSLKDEISKDKKTGTQNIFRENNEEEQLNYYACGLPPEHHIIVEENLPDFAKCNIFYYGEDYYDYVNSQAMLIEIAKGKINHCSSVEVVSKYTMLAEESGLPLPPPEYRGDLDYYFIFRHPGKGKHCIGGIKYNSKENEGITAKFEPDLYIRNNDSRLRYGTKYINKNNESYRYSSMEENGDVRKDLVAKDTAYGVKLHYDVLPYEHTKGRKIA